MIDAEQAHALPLVVPEIENRPISKEVAKPLFRFQYYSIPFLPGKMKKAQEKRLQETGGRPVEGRKIRNPK